MPEPSHPDDPRPLGGSASPFDTDEVRPISVPVAPEPAPASPPASDGYELEGYSPPEVEEPPKPVPIPPMPADRVKPRPRPKAEPVGVEESGSTEFVTEVSEVDPVWTRMGECGSDLTRVVSAGLGTLFLAWLLWNVDGLPLTILAAGGAITAFLSYPLLITLERPVRITPEQAVADFYGAASHHFPHYKRMWLLLSVLGRRSGKFSTFEDFRDHWKARIDRWKAAKGVGKYTPLAFEVDNFRADKSTGKETSRADYTVNIYARGRESEGPIESFRMVHGLVRGPDRMWYLNRGVLDQASR